MKIGMNLLDLYPGKIGGLEQYIRNFISCFCINNKNDSIVLFLNSTGYETFEDVANKLLRIKMDKTSNLEELVGKYIEDTKIDLWFCPLLSLYPKYLPIPKVITIPDIQHKYYPEFFSKEVMEFRNREFPFSIENSDAVITISEFSKVTIVEHYHTDSKKIFVTYLDADSSFYSTINETRSKEVKMKYNLPDKYFIYPANTWEHKNHKTLFEAIEKYKQKYESNIQLVLTGAKLDSHNELNSLISKLDIRENIISLGYILQEDMQYIYNNATALIFPSLFEGFGIPIIEAFRSNCPVACSDSGSLPEVAQDATLYFNPLDANDIADKIYELAKPAVRDTLVVKGQSIAAKFSWEANYTATMDIFENVYQEFYIRQKDMPLVSIITPSYNQGRFIKETIDSVLSQDYPNIEYIVVDALSKDETVDILKSYGDKIKWISEKDDGQADAVNKGIKMAKGTIIGWLNSDDIYLPGAVSKIVNIFNSYKNVEMIYGEGWHVTETGAIMDRYPTYEFDYNLLANNCFICQPTTFFRRAVFEKAGYLDKELQLCMDYELWMRIGKNCSIGYTPFYLATSRMYEDNKTLGRRKEVYEEIIRTVKLNYGYAPLSWVNGYVDYVLDSKGSTSISHYINLLKYYIIFNRKNLSCCKNDLKYISRKLYESVKYSKQAPYTEQYEDGWLSNYYIGELEVSNKKHLNIEIGHLLPIKRGIEIRILINGEQVERIRAKANGTYTCNINLDKFVDQKVRLELITNKYCIPHDINKSGDKRKLSVMLYKKELL